MGEVKVELELENAVDRELFQRHYTPSLEQQRELVDALLALAS